MTEENTDNNSGFTIEAPETFVITVHRKIEMDVGPGLGRRLKEQFETETVEAALAQSVAEIEANEVEPTEKLLNLDVDVDGPSDD